MFAHHGVFEHERRDGQNFLVDLRSAAPRRRSRPTVSTTPIDYGAVCDRVVELVNGGPYNLLERLAAVVADDLIERFPLDACTSPCTSRRPPSATPSAIYGRRGTP